MSVRVFITLVVCFTAFDGALSPAGAREPDGSQLYWGDTHLHTAYSPDASLNGNTRIGPAEAYRFARGEVVEGHSGAKAKLKRPLDFLVVSDHAEYLGLLPRIRAKDALVMENEVTRRWSELIASGDEAQTWKAMFEVLHDIEVNKPSFDDSAIRRSAWDQIVATADKYNDPGRFTALIGFEWTSMPNGNNLHRVVVYKDGADKAGQLLPFSSFDGERPEQLWAYLDGYEAQTGGQALAIPHNGNMSNGQMFQLVDFDGNPMDSNYASRRIRWEPLYEVTQIKGDGETHPNLSPEDPYADFENWDKGNLTANASKQAGMLQYEYARSALKNGLKIESQIGVNPYRFGLIGSSDAHTGFAAVDEANFWGKFSVYEPGLHRLTHQPVARGKLDKAYDLWAYETVASGYAAIWARENTRAELFAAMKRKETYATTGSRIQLQLFAGWEFSSEDVQSKDFAKIGYRKGVPMGSTITAPPAGRSPSIVINAAKDPAGVLLERVQVVKGWVDENGSLQEQLFEVAVDSAGATEFAVHWQDPAFVATQRAFYYVRVMEVPRPRWTTTESERLKTEAPDRVPSRIQDRAYSSPIWYTP